LFTGKDVTQGFSKDSNEGICVDTSTKTGKSKNAAKEGELKVESEDTEDGDSETKLGMHNDLEIVPFFNRLLLGILSGHFGVVLHVHDRRTFLRSRVAVGFADVFENLSSFFNSSSSKEITIERVIKDSKEGDLLRRSFIKVFEGETGADSREGNTAEEENSPVGNETSEQNDQEFTSSDTDQDGQASSFTKFLV